MAIDIVGAAPAVHGALTWLSREMTEVDSVSASTSTRTATSRSARAMAAALVIPERGDGNAAVEARWGAEWTNT